MGNNDSISRQAAIDALADYIHNVDKVYSTGHLSMSDCEDAARSVIEDLPSAQPEQRWIPCSERLPEKAEGRYWVCTNTGYQCQCRWTDDVYGIGSNGEWAWKIFDIPQYSHVIAWMPLPDPYREES